MKGCVKHEFVVVKMTADVIQVKCKHCGLVHKLSTKDEQSI